MEFGLSRTIQLASRSLAGLRPARELVAELVSDLSQKGSSYLDMSQIGSLAAGLRPARELVCDLLESNIVPDRPNSITLSSSLPGRRPARELVR